MEVTFNHIESFGRYFTKYLEKLHHVKHFGGNAKSFRSLKISKLLQNRPGGSHPCSSDLEDVGLLPLLQQCYDPDHLHISVTQTTKMFSRVSRLTVVNNGALAGWLLLHALGHWEIFSHI